jgi:AbrB family looped-hinge helix DNA binding protein
MRKVKVSSKGQVTIPADLRKQYDIKKGDNLLIKKSDSGYRRS